MSSPDCSAWRLPESQKRPKKCKNVLFWAKSMAFRTEKNLKSKNSRGIKVFILAKDVNTKENFESKPNKCRLKKGLFFLHPNSGSWSQIAWILFYKMSILQQNIYSLKKLAHPLHYKLRYRGGGPKRPPPSIFCLAKGPAFYWLMVEQLRSGYVPLT